MKNQMVFDSKLGSANGGDSKTDSFFREAVILRVYECENGRYQPDLLADVMFLHDKRVSRGHFMHMMEDL